MTPPAPAWGGHDLAPKQQEFGHRLGDGVAPTEEVAEIDQVVVGADAPGQPRMQGGEALGLAMHRRHRPGLPARGGA